MNTLPSTHWSLFRRTVSVLFGVGAASLLFAQPATQTASPTNSEFPARNVTGTLVKRATVNLAEVAKANAAAGTTATTGSEHYRNLPLLRPPKSGSRSLLLSGPTVSSGSTIKPASMPSPDIPGFGRFTGFNGLTLRDERLAGGGDQFNVEPPDQALAVGNGFIVEGVNDAWNIYSTLGVPQLAAPITANQFFNLPPTFVRPDGPFGPFPSDPVVLFDSTTGRFFAIIASIEQDFFTGAFKPSTRLHIAVSQTSNPTGAWTIFTLDSTDAFNPDGKGPRLPDYEKISFDANGFYISSNEFQMLPDGSFGNYIGASIRAISKSALEQVNRIAPPPVVEIQLPFNPSLTSTEFNFTLYPAKVPPGAPFASQLGGIQYFVSSDALHFVGTDLAVWTLFNTSSLNTSTPNLGLKKSTVNIGTYSNPTEAMDQKPGPIPLGDSLGEPESKIDPGDVRANSLDFADGRLWGTLDTQVVDSMSHPRQAGIFFVLTPTSANPAVATVNAHKLLFVDGANVTRAAVGTNKFGFGAIVHTLVGPTFFPSSSITPFNGVNIGPVTITANGHAPEDGFTGYPEFTGGHVARWGDYSFAAVSDSDQSTVFLGTEYIPNLPRVRLGNWGTYVTKYIFP